jgi:hypothetical protein
MATVKWSAAPASRGTVLTTELNALANAAYSAAGPAYDNTSNLDQWFWFDFTAGGTATPTAGANLQIFAVPSLDGTNYADAASSTQVGFHQLVATISIKTGAGTKRDMTLYPVQLPPGKFKFVLKNGTGVALAATGNTLTLYSANEQVA